MTKASPSFVVIDRDDLFSRVERSLAGRTGIDLLLYDSVLPVIGENGPTDPSALIVRARVAGPFLSELLAYSAKESDRRIPVALVGRDEDGGALLSIHSRDHIRWIDESRLDTELPEWISLPLELHDLRHYRRSHEQIAQDLHRVRSRVYAGELDTYAPPIDPPCGPPLPTHLDEIQPLRESRAVFERGLIRAALREKGSLKETATALGISYSSLWRRMRER